MSSLISSTQNICRYEPSTDTRHIWIVIWKGMGSNYGCRVVNYIIILFWITWYIWSDSIQILRPLKIGVHAPPALLYSLLQNMDVNLGRRQQQLFVSSFSSILSTDRFDTTQTKKWGRQIHELLTRLHSKQQVRLSVARGGECLYLGWGIKACFPAAEWRQVMAVIQHCTDYSRTLTPQTVPPYQHICTDNDTCHYMFVCVCV